MNDVVRTETDEELLRSRELLETVLAHAPGFIIALDESGKLEFINRLLPQHDSGAGIDEPIRDRIFEPFFTTKEVGKGTGQGLAIAWRYVTENHGGRLSFETALGKGTTFTLRLPVAGKT